MCVKVEYVNFNNKRRYDDDDEDRRGLWNMLSFGVGVRFA